MMNDRIKVKAIERLHHMGFAAVKCIYESTSMAPGQIPPRPYIKIFPTPNHIEHSFVCSCPLVIPLEIVQIHGLSCLPKFTTETSSVLIISSALDHVP